MAARNAVTRGTNTMSDFALDVDKDSFEETVVNGSQQRLVVVDFWAPWCAPCKALKPILEKLAEEYQGRFLLAMVNADDNQQLLMDYEVRGIPSVKAFLGGRVIDEFSGALAEGYVRDFLDRNIPSPARDFFTRARVELKAGNLDKALGLLNEALELDPSYDSAKVEKAGILLDQGRLDEADALLSGLEGDILDYQYTQTVMAKARFARQAKGLPVAETLKKAIADGNNPLQARLDLATLLAAREDYEGALEQLLELMKLNPGYEQGAARKAMLAIFDMLESDSELVHKYRRLMASLLH
jgi:putative thioredoxin